MPVSLLYFVTVFIWGTTWYAIDLQLGIVSPILSVSWRFIVSAAFLFLWIFIKKIPCKFSYKQHMFFMVFGACLFGFNYVFFYITTQYLISGLVALIFGSIVIFNGFFDFIFNKTKPSFTTFIGSMMGLLGLVIVFWDNIVDSVAHGDSIVPFLFGIIATIFASLGNMIANQNNKNHIPLVPAMAWGMLYGAVIVFVVSQAFGAEIVIDTSFIYISSLLYLSLFGSIIAFFCYISLIKEIGPTRAAYSAIMFPLIALSISTLLEGYVPTIQHIAGIAVALGGNFLVIYKKK